MSVPPASDTPHDALVDAVMTASRALPAVTARSLAAVDEEVTLPQYRALVLAQRGPRRRTDLSRLLGVLPVGRRRDVADALRAFSDAAGEVPETEWALAPVWL